MSLPEQRAESAGQVPLFVDLDGTLVASDTSVEASFRLIRHSLAYALRLPFWLLRGRAYLKRRVAESVQMQADALPFREDFVAFLRGEHARGRRLILTTAADQSYAEAVADYLGLFDAAVGSDGVTDLAGARKLAKLKEMTEGGPFDYAGDDLDDLAIFPKARKAILAHPVPAVRLAARRMTNVERIFDSTPRRFGDLLRALRPQRWPANLLVLLPLAMSGATNAALWGEALVGLICWCLCSAAIYLYHDLLHLAELRALPVRQRGPVADGRVAIQRAAQIMPLLALPGLVLAGWLSWPFLLILLSSLALAFLAAQDWQRLPRRAIVAGFFLLRVAAGLTLLPAMPSFWLLLLALSLTLVAALVFESLGRERQGYL